MIYLDNSATISYQRRWLPTRKWLLKSGVIPSNLHSLGSQATRLLEASRRPNSRTFRQVFVGDFYVWRDEGDNWVLKGVAFEKFHWQSTFIVSNIEHPAVKKSALWLQSQG